MKIILTKQEILQAFNLKEPCEIEIAQPTSLVGQFIEGAPVPEKDNKSFYKKFFNLAIENPPPTTIGNISLVIPKELNCEQIYKAMQGEFSCWKYYSDIDTKIKEQQKRQESAYTISFRDSIEPDNEHLGKSYNDFCNDGKTYMTPKEGMLASLYYFYKTGNMMDIKGATRFHALDSDSHAMYMFGSGDGGFRIGGYGSVDRDSDFGPREVSF